LIKIKANQQLVFNKINKMKKIIYTFLLLLFIGAFTNEIFAQTNWKAPIEADIMVNPLSGDADSVKKGKKVYTQMCVICHGAKGKGDGIASASLNPKPANFIEANIQEQTDGAIFWKLTNGKAPMAAYKDILSETQRWELVNYIRTFKK